MRERYLSLAEACEILGKSERTLYRWIKSGKLKAYKPGRDYEIPESAIREMRERSQVYRKVQASLFEEDEQRRSLETVRDGYARIIDAWADHIRVRARSWGSAEPGTLDEERAQEEAREVLDTSRAILGAVESVVEHDAGSLGDPHPLVQSLLDTLSEMDFDLKRIGQSYQKAPLLGPAGFSPEWNYGDSLMRHFNQCSDPGCKICPEGSAGDLEAQERRAASVQELPRSAS